MITATAGPILVVRLGFVHSLSVRLVFIVYVRMIGYHLFMVRCFFQFGGSHWLSDYNLQEVEDVGCVFLGTRAMVPAGDSQNDRASVYQAHRRASDLGDVRAFRAAGGSEDYRRKVFRSLGRELTTRINVVFTRWFVDRLRRLRTNRPRSFAFGAVDGLAGRSPLRNAELWGSRHFFGRSVQLFW